MMAVVVVVGRECLGGEDLRTGCCSEGGLAAAA